MARLRAAVRRGAPDRPPRAVVPVGDLEVDLARKRVRRRGADVRLTPTEWALLELLARNPGRLVTREQLLREVWGPAYEPREALPAGLLRAAAAQARGRSCASAAPGHLAGSGLHPGAMTRLGDRTTGRVDTCPGGPPAGGRHAARGPSRRLTQDLLSVTSRPGWPRFRCGGVDAARGRLPWTRRGRGRGRAHRQGTIKIIGRGADFTARA